MTSLLSLRGVAVEIGDATPLVDVSFDVPAGSCVGIVGETGSGKSLTCRVIVGLIRRVGGRVTTGTVLFEGRDLLTLSGSDWRAIRGREIAAVPQASMLGLDPVMRIGSQLEEAVRWLDPGSDPKRRARELLEQVHMPRLGDVSNLYPHELSGGMRQRVMIALALGGRPKLLVADEPTTALDVTVQRAILELLAELSRSTGMSVILITHDLAVVQAVAETVVVMYAGRVVESGSATSVLVSPAHPYTRALLAARPLGLGSTVNLAAIPGSPPSLTDRPPGCSFHPRCPASRNRSLCREESPILRTIQAPTHASACHFAEEVCA